MCLLAYFSTYSYILLYTILRMHIHPSPNVSIGSPVTDPNSLNANSSTVMRNEMGF